MVQGVNPTIFRAYDIRGFVGSDLTEESLQTLGQAAGTLFRSRGAQRLVIGRDARLSSPLFQAAFIAGLRKTGCDVIDIGQVPTPLMYFAVEYLRADGGAVISASHNPPEYNGLKLRWAHPIFGSAAFTSSTIQEMAWLANSGKFAQGCGTLFQAEVATAYGQSVSNILKLPPTLARPPRVVIDGGNGVAGPLAVQTLTALGAEVIPLYIEPDGHFPHHHPDPLKAKNLTALQQMVCAHKADLGLALDGDGDRLGVVDETGAIVWADRYLIVLAQYLLAQRPGPVVFDVMCSTVLADAVRSFGGTPLMAKTGYASILAKMRETNAILGGELSGHTFATYPGHYFDDATFAGAQLLCALCRLDGQRLLPLSEALKDYPALASLDQERIRFTDTVKFRVIDYVRQHFAGRYPLIEVDGVRVDFGDGWGIIRASNTEPVITTRFEAQTQARVEEIRALMLGVVEEFRHSKGLSG